MKFTTLLFLLFLSAHLQLFATNPNLTSVLQPVNLVGQSRQGCIPLAPAIGYANYGQDPKTRSFAEGALPGGATIAPFPNGPLFIGKLTD